MDEKQVVSDFDEIDEVEHYGGLGGYDIHGFDSEGIHEDTGTKRDLQGFTREDYEEMEAAKWEEIAKRSEQLEAEMEAEADARYLEELRMEGIELKDEVDRLKNKLAQAERLLAQYNKSKNRENEKDINGLDIGE